MRKTRNILLIILALILITSGALLPSTTSMIQDRQIGKTDDTLELEQVQILIQQELNTLQLLTLLGNQHTSIAWDSGTSLSQDEVIDCVLQVMDAMIDEGLLSSSAISGVFFSEEEPSSRWNGTAEPYLVISNSENQAAILWQCTWKALNGAVYTVWIDDNTETMCGMSRTVKNDFQTNFSTYAESDQYSVVTSIDMDTLLLEWVSFLNTNYGLWTLDLDETYSDDNKNIFTLTLSPDTEIDTQNTCTIRLIFEGRNISFII